MTRRLRENALPALLCGAAIAVLAWIGLGEYAWNDYGKEAAPAVAALIGGHFGDFLHLAPLYGSSLLLRAPFALAADIWNGGQQGAYVMLALPCLIASAALGVWLNRWMRERERPLISRALAVALCVCSPLTLLALEIGHPEELLGGVLCVVAVLAAGRGRWVWAGLALGLAIANKQWALFVVGPVLLALPHRRIAAIAIAGAISIAFTAPFALFAGSAFASNVSAAASSGTGTVFQPWQIWWFLGHPGSPTGHLAELYPTGYRIAPAWIAQLSHPLIEAIAVPLTAATWLRGRARRAGAGGTGPLVDVDRALLLLCVLLLLRCMLDPWDNIYYPIPFVVALTVWETRTFRRPALIAFAATAALYGGHHWMAMVAGPNTQAAFFAAWTVPLTVWMCARLFRGPARAHAHERDPQPASFLEQLRHGALAARGG